jgi:Ribbon-helix-helix protein, copG family
MSSSHGTRADGTPITDDVVAGFAEEAEQGYDVEQLLRPRQPGRPPLGSSAAAAVESVRLDPELKRDLLLRAAREQVSVSELIRQALRQYLHAN